MDDNAERQRRRRARRKRRLSIAFMFLFAATIFVWFLESQDTTTLIITRHAETVELGGRNPRLSKAGQRRANVLARMMRMINVGRGIDNIFVGPNKRSRDTAMPLAMRSDAPVETIDNPGDVKGLAKYILDEYKGDVVLIVTEAEYIPRLVKAMKGRRKALPIAEDEYDNIYIVSKPWFGKVETLRMKYGRPYRPKSDDDQDEP